MVSHNVLLRTTPGRMVSHQRPTGEVTMCSRGLRQDAWYHISGLQENSQCALEDYIRTHGITSVAYRRSHSVLSRTTSGRMVSHQRPTGEVTVCSRGLRQDAVSRTTDTVRQAAAATAVTAHRVVSRHRATVLRTTGRQDAHRHAHTRHAAEWRLFQLAIHDRPVATSTILLLLYTRTVLRYVSGKLSDHTGRPL